MVGLDWAGGGGLVPPFLKGIPEQASFDVLFDRFLIVVCACLEVLNWICVRSVYFTIMSLSHSAILLRFFRVFLVLFGFRIKNPLVVLNF